MNLMDMLRPKRTKLSDEQLAENKRIQDEADEKVRVAKQRLYNYVYNELCWDWFGKNRKKDQFAINDKVVINTLLTGPLPIRRDLFCHPEEGYISTRAFPAFDHIINACVLDPHEIAIRYAKGWIDEDYFKKLVEEEFAKHTDKFFIRYGVTLKNPTLKRHFNNGEAGIPEFYLVKRDSEMGIMLHSIGLMERHIYKQQDDLNKAYASLDEYVRKHPAEKTFKLTV